MDQMLQPLLPGLDQPVSGRSTLTLKIPNGQDLLEITVDPDHPIVEMANNAVTGILCPCGEHLISSQRQLEAVRTWYHVHCPRCGRAGSIPGEAWRKMMAMLAPQLMAS